MIQDNKKSNTIKSYVSALRSVLTKDGVELNENKCLLTCLTKACRLKNDKVYTRLPIRHGLLQLLIQSVTQVYDSQPYLVKLYQAMLVTAYYGLFRIGEITSSQHVIKAIDVHVGDNKDKLMFVLHSSKTHCQGDKPQIIKITGKSCENSMLGPPNWTKTFCPFNLLRLYVSDRKKFIDKTEPFFIFRDRTPVSAVISGEF